MSSQVQKQTLIYDLSAHILPYIGRKWPSLLAQKVGKTHPQYLTNGNTISNQTRTRGQWVFFRIAVLSITAANEREEHVFVISSSVLGNGTIQRHTVPPFVLFFYGFHVNFSSSSNNPCQCTLIRSLFVDR